MMHSIKLFLVAGLLIPAFFATEGINAREIVNLSGTGWRLWLDTDAEWENDALFLPPVDLTAVPVNPPTCGWQALYAQALLDVSVPGTVEEYLWDQLGDFQGVSWWLKEFTLSGPQSDQVVKLCFEAVRLRCEVYLNEELVGYDLVGNTPFEVNISDHVLFGQPNRLALRITDPGGNFSWEDYEAQPWGNYMVPASHGFGGVTGRLFLERRSEVYIKDVFVMNKPVITEVDLQITLANESGESRQGDVTCQLRKVSDLHPSENAALDNKTLQEVHEEKLLLMPGETKVKITIHEGGATLWNLNNPVLYTVKTTLNSQSPALEDTTARRFGFRWFEVEGHGTEARFRLNGKRIVLRSAISWGFWPVNGIYPTPELARQHVTSAKALGLNMLNFHRGIGWPIVLDAADEQGLLYYEEPGGYTSLGGSHFARNWAREKLLRMVKRDRNHPSLIIYNMINEQTLDPNEQHKNDMRTAHELDPTRIITYVSGWVEEADDPMKLHMLPYDDKQYLFGWHDCHHAAGPGVYMDDRYNDPDDYYLHTDNSEEIVFYGEEGAIAAPPRLALLHQHYTQSGWNGWDGKDYLEWNAAYENYIEEKNLAAYFPSIDELCVDMGTIAYDYQGRIIENIRINNLVDGYVVNGYECEKLENHSGIVDCFRQFKGRREVLAHYNQPVYLAIKARSLVRPVGGEAVLDLHIVNEVDLKGPHTLTLNYISPKGRKRLNWYAGPVTLTGGDRFGELLVEGLSFTLNEGSGHYEIEAKLINDLGQVAAAGFERIFAVPDWRPIELPKNGALLEEGDAIDTFLKEEKGLELPKYKPDMGAIDYLVTARNFRPPAKPIPHYCYRTPDGRKEGLNLAFFKGRDFETAKGERFSTDVSYNFKDDPKAEEIGLENFSLRWTGFLVPDVTGHYLIVARTDHKIRLWLNDTLVIDNWENSTAARGWKGLNLVAGQPYTLRLDYAHAKKGAYVSLDWIHADAEWLDLEEILKRVEENGTLLFVLKDAAQWANKIQQYGPLTYLGEMQHKKAWMGGNFFVRDHFFFDGLPVNCAMNWEYQALVHYGNAGRTGLILEGEEAVVGCVTGHTHQVATAVGVVPYGKGKIVFSTLDLAPHLATATGADEVAKLIFCNYLAWAAEQ